MDSVRVLLVEDDDDNRELMTEVLETAGYQVVTAASGREALSKLAEQPIDLLITDVGMPGMGGLEVARAAKQIAPGVPVVVVTGYAEREDITNARGRELDAVLVKPVDPDLLTKCVADLARARLPSASRGAPS